MAPRKKQPGSTVTLGVSVSPKDRAVPRRRAKRSHGGNAAGDALRLEESRQAFAAKLERELGPLEPEVTRAILMETLGLLPPRRLQEKLG